MSQPALTLLCPNPPYPPLSGGTAHTYQAARQLARRYTLRCYALAADPAGVRWGELAACSAELRAFARDQRPGWGIDPPAVYQERSQALIDYVNKSWQAQPPALVQIEFTSMAQYAPLARRAGAKVICTAHNVAFLAQVRRARAERGLALRARRWLGALSLWRYELRALPQCDLVVTLSQPDADALKRWLPRLRVEYVPAGISLAEWPVCFSRAANDHVLFVGNYAHPPNLEGALWLAREVWPLVLRARPQARLTLAGRAPPPAITALASPSIAVPGTRDDLRPLYASASLVAAPIFWGSGVRIKLLEALACGLPVVSTALAAEGIDLRDGASALFAERPAEFAAAIVRLLADPALRERLGAAGRSIAERDYDWARVGDRLAALYDSVLQ